ncbi:hypothetical protein HDU93_008249 [Gonapodya sp. JEL0774]|nr:hypothetical protein HDU93_008249 [Gonapodya sp. JEL0774]
MAPPNVQQPPSYEKAMHIANAPPTQDPRQDPLQTAPLPPSNVVQPMFGGNGSYVVTLPTISFEMSRVPQQYVMLWDQKPNFDGPSRVEIERSGDADVRTYDVRTAFDPDELLHYFLTYSDRPQLFVKMEGTHTEHWTEYESYTDGQGNRHTRPVHRQRVVTDFNISMDASSYIHPQWTHMAAIQGYHQNKPFNVPTKTIREVLTEYTNSDNILKEIHLRKQIRWDFDSLTPALVVAVRNAGYGGHISVTYPTKNDSVTAKAPNFVARATDSCLVKTLCVVTCLCICFWPAWILYRKKVDALIIEFPAVAPGSVFYQRNYYNIVAAVARRQFGQIVTY